MKLTLPKPSWRLALIGAAAIVVLALAALGITAAVLYRDLPGIDALSDYHPKQSLRVFTSDGVEIAQFGTERRYYRPIGQIPKLMQDAVLAVEDAGFREHGGVSLRAVFRAAIANLTRTRSQGGSTITQQVARNFFLSSRKTYTRKLKEIMLALKIEHQLDKDQVLELYMNQIYLGQRSYGFAAAADTYFGKPLAQLTVAEAAMLAGLPQNPSYANPVADPERARKRQLWVLDRMRATGVIDDAQLKAAQAERVAVRRSIEPSLHAEYVAEMVRQKVFAQYGEKAYTLGLKVYTSLRAADQQAAYAAVRKGLIDFERRQPYRGPEDEEVLPEDAETTDAAQLLAEHDDDDDLRVALVTAASAKAVEALLANGDTVRIAGDGLRQVQAALSARASDDLRIRRGSVIRVVKAGNGWSITQWPQAEGALVSLDPLTGQVRALVGGFDFQQNQFNHVTQAMRQPGSSFKPFLYSAAMEHGVMPASVINDAPLPTTLQSGEVWDPQNADGRFDGPLTLREALALSKNLVSIRLVQLLGPAVAREWAARFGFDPAKQPDNLTLALGAGATTPLQLASAYAVLANGGLRVEPVVIQRITDAQDNLMAETPLKTPTEADRAIPARNAFLIDSLLNEVTRSGTAALAQKALRRPDLYGKTGTTNDAVDAWFAGFQPSLVSVVWMGYDTPRSLGSRESGGGLSLPIWIDYMRTALKGVPQREPDVPPGVVKVDGEWTYDEWALGGSVTNIGFDAAPPEPAPPAGALPLPVVSPGRAPPQTPSMSPLMQESNGR